MSCKIKIKRWINKCVAYFDSSIDRRTFSAYIGENNGGSKGQLESNELSNQFDKKSSYKIDSMLFRSRGFSRMNFRPAILGMTLKIFAISKE